MGRLLWEEPLVVKPERWLDEQGKIRQPSPYKFSTFQAGPRVCLGMNMAYLEVKTLATTVLMSGLRLRLQPGQDLDRYAPMPTLTISGGVWCSTQKV